MVCKITFTKQVRRREAAYTLVETSVGMGLAVMLILAVVSFSLYSARSFAGLGNYVDLETSSQKALDTMTRDIRQTRCLEQIKPNELVFRDWDGKTLSFRYAPEQKTLLREKDGAIQVLLSECDFLVFSNYQRNPYYAQYEQYPVTTAATNTKLISVSWLCSRKITGTRLNTESVQTAKIVIRNQ